MTPVTRATVNHAISAGRGDAVTCEGTRLPPYVRPLRFRARCGCGMGTERCPPGAPAGGGARVAPTCVTAARNRRRWTATRLRQVDLPLTGDRVGARPLRSVVDQERWAGSKDAGASVIAAGAEALLDGGYVSPGLCGRVFAGTLGYQRARQPPAWPIAPRARVGAPLRDVGQRLDHERGEVSDESAPAQRGRSHDRHAPRILDVRT
jgi:hypothetical protein